MAYSPFQINAPAMNQPSFDFGFQSGYDPSLVGQANTAIAGMQPGTGGGWSLFGGPNQAGVLPTAIQGVNALAQGWLGFQQLDLAKDTLSFQKEAFNKNYANQRQLTNQQLLDRQRARYAANPNAYAAPDAGWQGQNLIR